MTTFEMTFAFRVNPGTSDPEKVKANFEQYLRDMLYVGADVEATDVFSIEDIENRTAEPSSGPNTVIKREQVSADVDTYTYYKLTDEQLEEFNGLADKGAKEEFLSGLAEDHYATEVGTIHDTLDIEFHVEN